MKLSLADARRIAVAGQLLPAAPRGTSILDVVRHIGYLQLDPTRAVERNHLLVLWSRLGSYSVEELQRLLAERELYEYSAAIVPTEDYPLHRSAMRRYPAYETAPAWNDRIKLWLKDNAPAQRQIVAQLRRHGPLGSRDLGDHRHALLGVDRLDERSQPDPHARVSLTAGQGARLEARRRPAALGRRRDVVPESVERMKSPPLREIVRRAADRSLRGLGVATPQEVRLEPFVGGPYPGIREAAEQIGRIAEVEGLGRRLVHPDAEPRRSRQTTLLSPFDPLIRNRERTQALFGFRFRLEIYVPKEKREFGFFVLPILHGDRLIGRVDPTMDRKANVFRVNAVFAEDAAPENAGPAIAKAVSRLAKWLGADEIAYSRKVPSTWRDSLRN